MRARDRTTGKFVASVAGILFFGLVILATAWRADAADEDMHRDVDSLSVYLGIVPTEIVRGHPRGHPERTMHGDTPAADGSYHVVVAIFDSATGARLSDLSVEGAVLTPGRSMTQKPLEPMTVAGVVTYGNFFPMPGYGEHRILVDILRQGATRPTRAEFTHVVRPR